MGNGRFQAIAVLVAIMLLSITFVPAVSASSDDTMEKWMKEHTVKVKSTITYEYDGNSLEIEEAYSGKDLKKKIGVEKLTKEHIIPLEAGEFNVKDGKLVVTGDELVLVSEEAGVVKMKKGEKKVHVTKKDVVLTSEDDLYSLESSSYPRWTWSKISSWYGTWYEREDPINLAWEHTDIISVKSEIRAEGWTDSPWEDTQYVYYGGKMIPGDGLADDRYRLFGGYHARLWLIDGAVAANAHHDDSVFWIWGHQADQYEEAEELVAGFYEYSNWDWYGLSLDNLVWNPWNDGIATLISPKKSKN